MFKTTWSDNGTLRIGVVVIGDEDDNGLWLRILDARTVLIRETHCPDDETALQYRRVVLMTLDALGFTTVR